MVTTQHLCAACGSEHIRCNGSSQGHAKYQYTSCGHQVRFVSAAVARAVRYAQVERLLALVKSLVQRLNERSLSGHVNASYCAAVGARKVRLSGPD